MRRTAPIACLLASLLPSFASAEDEERLQLMRETTSYTDVADAADGDDPFDAYVRFGFQQSRTSGTIRRETTDGSGIPSYQSIGDYQRVRNVLEIGADVGLFHDLALTFRLPVILSDSYTIGVGDAGSPVTADLTGGTENLFNLPFSSPTRSGIDTMHLGFAWAPLNQNRVHEVPSWVILGDVGLPVGPRLRPCLTPSQCATRDSGGAFSLGSGDPGISRGNVIFHLETRVSRRHRYVEPYFGLGATMELPTGARSTFQPVGNLNGYQHTLPPIVGELTLGSAFIPWENLPSNQRFVIDARFTAAYVSNGRDYSPLYDLLGTSQAPSMTSLNCEDGGPDVPGNMCPTGMAKVPFNGLTDTQAYARFGGRIAIEVQAAKYVLFSVGANIQYMTEHYLSSADICNANYSSVPVTRSGQVDCISGIYNPHYRQAIDEPGRRFDIGGSVLVDLFARATAMF